MDSFFYSCYFFATLEGLHAEGCFFRFKNHCSISKLYALSLFIMNFHHLNPDQLNIKDIIIL
jgi:hypothetical protein